MAYEKLESYLQKRKEQAERAAYDRRMAALRPYAKVQPSSDLGPSVRGELVIQVRTIDRETGKKDPWIPVIHDNNLVVTQAESLMANMAAGLPNSALNYIELGDPAVATPPALTDTGLEQTTAERKAVTLTVNTNMVTAEVTFGVGEANGNTYTEAGLFTGPFAGGTMFARKTGFSITKTAAFEMKFTWIVTFLVSESGDGCTGIGLVGPQTVANTFNYVDVAGGDASVAVPFEFAVGALRLDVYQAGVRKVDGVEYTEANAPLNAPIGGTGSALNKGVNLVGFTSNPGDRWYIVHRTIS